LSCGHSAPAAYETRAAVHGAASFGGANRSGPVGGDANGIPSQMRTPSAMAPCTGPWSVVTSVGPSAGALEHDANKRSSARKERFTDAED
jgi:hypothetical protein